MSKEKAVKETKLAKTLKKVSRRPWFKRTLIIFGVLLASLAFFVFGFNLSYGQRIYPNTFVGGVDLGGKTLEEAQKAIEKAIEANPDKKLTLSYKKESWALQGADLSIAYDAKKSADLAWAVGRTGQLSKILKEQLRAVFSSNQDSVVFTYNQEKLQSFLAELSQKIDRPEKDAWLKVEDSKPQITPEEIGLKLNKGKNETIILDLLGQFEAQSEQALVVDEVSPKITQVMMEKILPSIQRILENEITLEGADKPIQLKAETFIPWLDFEVGWAKDLKPQVDLEKVKAYIADLAGQINQEARDAKFQMKDGRAMAFQTSQTGRELDQEKAIKLISETILNAQPKLELPIKTTQPDVSSSGASTQGIKELVGEGTTSWRGSPANRIHNLTLGSQNISGTVVNPGEEFSTIKAIGPIDEEHGFKKELVIKNGTQVVPDVGGGLCQVSTTLFRAVLNTGLKITARINHSFRVSYYEPPVGMDATIFDPLPDFKFINDMKYPILIWATPTDNGLTFQIYGTKDGRQVEVSAPSLYNYVNPGEPIYTVTETMAPGTIRQVERATRGVTASFKYKVTAKNGDMLEDQTFVSKYIPVPDTFLVGPGYEIPKTDEQ